MGAIAIPIASTTADSELVELNAARGQFCGWSLRESGAVAAVATVIFRAGESAADTDIVGIVELAANGSHTGGPPVPITIQDSLFLDVVAGEVEGCVYFAR